MFIKNMSYAVALLVPLFGSGTAFAEVACGNSTCPRGFSCETESAGCPAIECVGENCKPCEPATYEYCKPLPCQADADCESGMVCTGVQYQGCTSAAPACSGPDCEAPSSSANCDQAAPVRECVPRWQLHCQTAADCGEGFTCEEEESCSCAGSGGSGLSPGVGTGGAEPSSSVPNTNDASETCSCEKTGAKVCELIEVACSSDADCVTGFTCEDNPDGSCTRSSDGQESCTPANPPKLCMPPYSGLSGSGAGVPTSNRGESEGSDGDRVSDAPRASGGCSVVNAGSPGGFAPALAMLGLALGVARRRRR